ncbi:MAG: sugar phosphate isomerase/epimerase [Bacteroidetes bacterium]|nr:sugar phosphate isomerase/epimerase [Bacteroidota bacterium]
MQNSAKSVVFRHAVSLCFVIWATIIHMNRRAFIGTSAMAVGGLCLQGLHSAPATSYGIQLYTVRDEVGKGLSGALQGIARAGYAHVELYGYNQRLFFGKSVAEMRTMLLQNGLRAHSGHYLLTDMLYDKSYDWQSWKYLLDDAKMLGHQYIVIPWLDAAHRTGDDFKRITERINQGAELAKAYKIKVSYHNHDFEFQKAENGKTFLENLIRDTDPASVEFELDIYWAVYAGYDPIELFNRFPGRFSLWHVKDMVSKPNGQTCEVGKGVIDWKSVFDAKKKSGMKYWFVEQEHYTQPVFNCIADSISYLKREVL